MPTKSYPTSSASPLRRKKVTDKTSILFQRDLACPFPLDRVSWRVGSTNKAKVQKETGDPNAKATKGVALAYIDARDVMGRLDAVMGIDGWDSQVRETASGRVLCDLTLHFPGRSVTRCDG